VPAYVDTSAFVKLVRVEPETEPLRTDVGAEPLVSSALLAVEVRRAAARLGREALDAAQGLLQRVTLLPLGAEVLDAAATLEPPALRSLDALHLATALSIGPAHLALYTYDDRLAEAARAHGFAVRSPGA
jgi:predicted nucleic acid-binding protein